MQDKTIYNCVFDKSGLQVHLPDIGLGDKEERIRSIVTHHKGMIVFAGPTGSGKSTTLHAALGEMSEGEINFIIFEDQTESPLQIIRQTQLNLPDGQTFEAGLKSILAQAPDTAMIIVDIFDADMARTELIRDAEVTRIALQEALAGRLVLAQMDAANAPDALMQLVVSTDAPSLVARATACILVQGLVRRICSACKTAFEPDESMLKTLGMTGQKVTLYKGEGCQTCSGSGFKRRAAIHEMLTMDEEIRQLLLTNASTDKIRHSARQSGMLTLREDGLKKALAGHTTVEEVLRVTAAVEG